MQRLWKSTSPRANATRFVIGIFVVVLFLIAEYNVQQTSNRLKEDRHNVNIACKIRNDQLDVLIQERHQLIELERKRNDPTSADRIVVWQDTINNFQRMKLDNHACDRLFPEAIQQTGAMP